MKRNTSLSTSLKGGGYSNTYNSPSVSVTKSSSYANNCHSEEHYMNGFPWPPRSYTCSFCRKEFKSAQALGGHMNVHRRDRARLRQSSPTPDQGQVHHPIPMLNLNLNPNCSTSSHLSSNNSSSATTTTTTTTTTLINPPTCTLPLFVSPNNIPSSVSPSGLNRSWVVVDGILLNPALSTKTSSEPIITRSSLSGIGEYDHAFAAREEEGCGMLKKKGGDQILRMDLEIGLPAREYHYDLDLELRLGTNYS